MKLNAATFIASSSRHSCALILMLVTACHATPKTAPGTCNGSAANCGRPYDQVTMAATHDAFSYASGGPIEYIEPNQDLPMHDQLAYGIRGFGIRPCPSFSTDPSQADVVYVTHNYGQLGGVLGGEPLSDILTEFQVFLEAHPSEVVTLLEEDTNVSSAQVAAVFHQLNLDPLLYAHTPGQPWPTLAEMAKTGTRLVVFTDASDTREDWQLPMWTYITDTDYNITDASQFSCAIGRGVITNDLYFINQFIYEDFGGGILAASPTQATIANNPVAAYQRAVQCWSQMGKIPVFVYVDFFMEGNVGQVVQELNELPR